MQLYYSPGACSLASHITAREAGVNIELKRADTKTKKLEDGSDYYAINSKGAVPALKLDNGQVLTEGVAIMQYLGDQKPQSGVVPPAGSAERYRLQEMLGYINSEIHKTYSPLFNAKTPAETVKERKEYLRKRYKLLDERFYEQRIAVLDMDFGEAGRFVVRALERLTESLRG